MAGSHFGDLIFIVFCVLQRISSAPAGASTIPPSIHIRVDSERDAGPETTERVSYTAALVTPVQQQKAHRKRTFIDRRSAVTLTTAGSRVLRREVNVPVVRGAPPTLHFMPSILSATMRQPMEWISLARRIQDWALNDPQVGRVLVTEVGARSTNNVRRVRLQTFDHDGGSLANHSLNIPHSPPSPSPLMGPHPRQPPPPAPPAPEH
ncbi:hypothetical protein IE81DRAFT_347679 [Ceraceosorus guamensis]|uniref:Uncharacterized protein n=1 Tax=Ceraceosorus guamensis TaxID=1522189 RepID=A0A316VXB6_9BASI|nr:hypothetical protein IE81DRAFT_347679 [Ceraceosorus guamensis]PWN42110.1 hypothetical protein IE81DRAFT_347679 [Ceraceosorus guamensis]